MNSNQSSSSNNLSNNDNNSNEEQFKCPHGCSHKFKSLRQKILHHNKLDNHCNKEKINLLKLIEQFHKTIAMITPNKKDRLIYKEYRKAIRHYNIVKNKIKDRAQFEAIIQTKLYDCKE